MDILKDTISREVKKRKQLFAQAARRDGDGDAAHRQKKYVRVADLAGAGSSDNTETDSAPAGPTGRGTAASTAASAAASTAVAAGDSHAQGLPRGSSSGGGAPHTGGQNSVPAGQGDVAGEQTPGSISGDEVVKRLRARGEPIRLFGEGDEQRRLRLRQLELSEEKTDGQQNEFRRVLAQVEAGAMLEDLKRQAKVNDDDEEKRRRKCELLAAYDISEISLELLRTDMDRLHTLLYVYFKRLLYEWDDYLASRPEVERRSPEGKMAAATQRQSAEYLRPLFRSLKQRKLQADVMARITEIARNMIDREYMRANDSYLQLSIGNAPWPIGVTQVGIHSRAARENINANKVAHVLNNETQRKWIQSIKRLIRFAQTKYPPTDMAKMAG